MTAEKKAIDALLNAFRVYQSGAQAGLGAARAKAAQEAVKQVAEEEKQRSEQTPATGQTSK